MKYIKDYGFDINLKDGIAKRDGATYDMSFLSDCCLLYERMCTAQYIRELNPRISYQDCYDMADEVRNLCDDYGYTESEAISELGFD